eukprot:13996560-Alexandrium_andersonii.AAC.1
MSTYSKVGVGGDWPCCATPPPLRGSLAASRAGAASRQALPATGRAGQPCSWYRWHVNTIGNGGLGSCRQ